MQLSKTNFFCACVVGLALITPAHNAPNSRQKGHSPSTMYNQKQTGEVNVQVHLKDIHIIALLDDALGGLGDYDYNYDYSDLTIKPILPATTVSPQESTNNTESSDVDLLKPQKEPGKPSDHPHSTVSPSTTLQAVENSVSTTPKSQPSTNSSTDSSQKKTVIVNPEKNSNSTTQKPNLQSSTARPKKPASPQKIQIPQNVTKLKTSGAAIENKSETPVTNISIVPVGKAGTVRKDSHLPLGEIMHYRKCAKGYRRDKQGRCRSRRTPQLRFDLSRLATNLASRFRQAATGSSS